MNVKRGDILKFQGLLGRVTFVDNTTKYVRLEHNAVWKAAGFLKDMTQPTPQEVQNYEMDALILNHSVKDAEFAAEKDAQRW